MGEAEAWAAYFYPGTRVLRNKLGIQDAEQLQEAERFLVSRRAEQLNAGYIPIPRTFDGDHLQAIHRNLFQDVYDFAGEWRDVHIGKRVTEGEEARWFLRPADIPAWMDGLSEAVKEVPWTELTRSELVTEIADVHTYLNLGHGFREGSGRTARIYLGHVLEQTAYRLDFDRVGVDEWNEASRDSIVPGKVWPLSGPLIFEPQERIFEKIVVDRASSRPHAETHSAVRLAQLDHPIALRPGTSRGTTAAAARRPASGGGQQLEL